MELRVVWDKQKGKGRRRAGVFRGAAAVPTTGGAV
jgi:hypothetical protein